MLDKKCGKVTHVTSRNVTC